MWVSQSIRVCSLAEAQTAKTSQYLSSMPVRESQSRSPLSSSSLIRAASVVHSLECGHHLSFTPSMSG
jgi:hypothetical protein